jgi:hypothetical protein
VGGREPDGSGHEAGSEVPEVPRRYGKDDRARAELPREPGPGQEVVEHLGEKPPDVDGVRRCQRELSAEIFILKGGLGQALAVVEIPLHSHGVDVSPKGRELPFLPGGDLPVGKKDDYPGSRYSQEGLSHGATRIS